MPLFGIQIDVSNQPEKPHPAAQAFEWVAKITTVALEMVLPGLAGQWLDDRWGTRFLVLVGFVFGLVGGVWHLLWMTGAIGQTNKSSKQDKDLEP
jgi:hypothetical protein